MSIFAYNFKPIIMIKTLILFFTLLSTNLSVEEKDAFKNYQDLGTVCVPNTLKDSVYTKDILDKTYVFKLDYNNIP
jgi:hypothetical protein